MNNLTTIQNMFENNCSKNLFKHFIKYIRFPFFKNFKTDLKVNFNFPITFLVGGNGSGKSSLLHAIYGAPHRYSIANFWYNTALDPIEDIGGNRHCFIYSYKTEHTKKNVEVLKMRIQKEGNPDYWEPARPQKKFDMDMNIPSDFDSREASKTRWNAINRNVYYMDFRYTLTAYDQYFYFGNKPQPHIKKLSSKQDVIRQHAGKVHHAFEHMKEVSYYKRKVEKPILLSDGEINNIKEILGKDYTKAKITEHNLYDRGMKGYSIKYQVKNSISYSEAYAGSGETAVVKLVHELLKVEYYSLVILDEPETSLHPTAQKALINFILEQIKIKKLQVVISTHSSDIIEDMPKESVKVLYENSNNKIDISEDIVPKMAFAKIGRFFDKKTIIVEDILAKLIIEKVMQSVDNASDILEVRYHPGGASSIKQDIAVHSKNQNNNFFVVFDGDQKPSECTKFDKLTEQDKNKKRLNEIIKCHTEQKIKFSVDSNDTEDKQYIVAQLKYLEYYEKRVFYLPGDSPENIIFSEEIINKADLPDETRERILSIDDTKEKIKIFSDKMFGCLNDSTPVYQYFLERFGTSDPSFEKMKSTVNDIIKLDK